MKRQIRFSSYQASSTQASLTKRRVGRSTTKPELAIREALWRRGHRYRVNVRQIPGTPDIVFKSLRVVIFCDGDFWHGRNWSKRRLKLATGSNAEYWLAKISSNMARDRRTTRLLETAGWTVLRFWETDVIEHLPKIVRTIEVSLRAA